MTKRMTLMDRAALAMIGVGLGGAMLGVVEFVSAPASIGFALLFVAGVVTETIVLRRTGASIFDGDGEVPDAVESAYVPNVGTDPSNPNAIGSYGWNVMRRGSGPDT